MSKVLYMEWNSYANDFIKAEFKRRKYELDVYDFPADEDTRHSETITQSIALRIIEDKPDFVFSLNYYPVIAIACKACNVKYISWTYDSPYIQLYSLTIEYPTNYAFIFDKSEYIRLKNLGIDTVYYLPMAATTEAFDKIKLTDEDRLKYRADVAMIGSMYSEKKHRLTRHFSKIDDYTRGYINAIMQAQKHVFGFNLMEEALTPEIIENLQKSAPMFESGDGLETMPWVFSNYFLARELTSIERFEYLEALSKDYNVTLYTHEATPDLPKVINKGSLDYYTEMPKAMKCAKINLNIALRSIVTGIPLRCMDILGCGGFLLTSYQADMLEFFEPDIDFVYYESKEDLVDKVGYYLAHNDERLKIADNGYKKARNYHTLCARFDTIEEIVFGKRS